MDVSFWSEFVITSCKTSPDERYFLLTLNIFFLGDVSEVKILQALLPSMPEMKLPMQRLVTPSGHHMVLSVTKSTDTQRQRNNYAVQIQCPTVFLLCQLRSAICSRVCRKCDNKV